MLAVAIQIPQFPANVRSDTYQIDYGRINGPEWMAESTSWYAPKDIPMGRAPQAQSDLRKIN